jgi:N4-(beta-N-acetylglucosaminyl)-L-asparaginase
MSSSDLSRRGFLATGAAAALTTAACAQALPKSAPASPEVFVRKQGAVCLVGSQNTKKRALELAHELHAKGTPLLDAIVKGINTVEDDPSDHTVGLGGMPNEDGVVELDASVMDGRTGLSGAVASVQDIRNPASVALLVMRYTDHCLLVGPGAKRFAKEHGFKEENLLTEDAREAWLYWKATLSDKDDRFPKEVASLPKDVKAWFGITGTVNACGLDKDGHLSGCTSTSGLAFKIPGRVGDSPIIGAGLYVDDDAGAAGSTGRGEANIITLGSAMVVEAMRRGAHPTDAAKEALERVVRFTKAPHLRRADGKPDFQLKFYAIDKRGRTGSFGMYAGEQYAMCDDGGARLVDCPGLFGA